MCLATTDVIAPSAPCAVCTEAQDRSGRKFAKLAPAVGGARDPGKYNLYLGAFDPSPLHKPYRQDVGHDDIVAALAPLIEHYAKERAAGDRFGDFVIRQGFVAPTAYGRATPTSARTSQHKPSGWALTARGSQSPRSAAGARPEEIAPLQIAL
jgi:hypothetical protein